KDIAVPYVSDAKLCAQLIHSRIDAEMKGRGAARLINQGIALNIATGFGDLFGRGAGKLGNQVPPVADSQFITDLHDLKIPNDGGAFANPSQVTSRQALDANLNLLEACFPQEKNVMGVDIGSHFVEKLEIFSQGGHRRRKSVDTCVANDIVEKVDAGDGVV